MNAFICASLVGGATCASTIDACLSWEERSFESASVACIVAPLPAYSIVVADEESDEVLSMLSSPDCKYFLLSGMVRRCQRVAAAGTRATPIWIRQTASSWPYSPCFRALLKQPRTMSVTMEPARVPYSPLLHQQYSLTAYSVKVALYSPSLDSRRSSPAYVHGYVATTVQQQLTRTWGSLHQCQCP